MLSFPATVQGLFDFEDCIILDFFFEMVFIDTCSESVHENLTSRSVHKFEKNNFINEIIEFSIIIPKRPASVCVQFAKIFIERAHSLGSLQFL